MIIWTVLFDSFLIPDSVIENGSIGWLFSKNLQSIKLMDSLLISKVIVSSDQFTLDGDSLIRSVEAANQWTNNKWNAIETLQGSRRMGVCGAAERQHALQRAAASVGPADCRVGVRFVPGPSQHLSAGMHRSPRHWLLFPLPRPEAAAPALRPRAIVQRRVRRWWTPVQHALPALSPSRCSLRPQHHALLEQGGQEFET